MPKRSSAAICCLSLLLIGASEASYSLSHVNRSPAKALRYQISSHGMNVGDLKTTISPVLHQGNQAVCFRSDLTVDADLIFFKKITRSQEEALLTEKGPVSYRKREENSGKSLTVDGTMEGGAFRFRLQENDAARNVSIARESYDYTTLDCPETRMKREGESMELRLLDMERAEVVPRRFHFLKSEEVKADDRTICCKVVDLADAHQSCRRWVSGDGRDVVIVRQEGKGKGGSYSLRLVSIAGEWSLGAPQAASYHEAAGCAVSSEPGRVK